MKCLFIVDGYFVTGTNVAQREEHYVPIDRPHIRVRFARMVDVMSPIAAATAIDTPDPVNITDAQLCSMSTPLRFSIRNSLARVFGDLAPLRKKDGSKAAPAIDVRFLNRETGCEVQRHLRSIVR